MFPAKGGDVHGLSYAVLVVQTRGGKSGRGQSCKSPPHGNVPRELVLPPGTHVEMGQTEGLVVIPGEPSVGTAWGQWQPLQPGGLESRASTALIPPCSPALLPSRSPSPVPSTWRCWEHHGCAMLFALLAQAIAPGPEHSILVHGACHCPFPRDLEADGTGSTHGTNTTPPSLDPVLLVRFLARPRSPPSPARAAHIRQSSLSPAAEQPGEAEQTGPRRSTPPLLFL